MLPESTNNSTQSPLLLIKKLSFAVDYISNSIVVNQNKLKSLIFGKINNISNNLYEINNYNLSINNISLSSEETVFNAKVVDKSILNISTTMSNKISFEPKIISFNTKLNQYQFINLRNTEKRNSVKININRKRLSKTNDSKYISHSESQWYLSGIRIILTQRVSKNYSLLRSSNNMSKNNYVDTGTQPKNNIFKFQYNKLFYSLLVIFPIIITPFFAHRLLNIIMQIINIKNNGVERIKYFTRGFKRTRRR